MRKIMYKKRRGHTLGIAFGITLLVLVLLAGSASATNVAYVSAQDASKLFVVDLDAKSVVKTIDIYTPTGFCAEYPPDINDLKVVNGKIFLSVPGSTFDIGCQQYQVKVIDPDSGYTNTIINNGTPSGLKVYNGKLYVVNKNGHWIQEIDPVTETTMRYIFFSNPWGINNPVFMEIVDNKIYLPFPGTGGGPGLIQVLNLTTGSVMKNISFSSIDNYGPIGIKQVSANKIYIGGESDVAVLDTTTDTIVKSFNETGGSVMAFATASGKVYTANSESNVGVIDLATDTLINSIDVGFHLYASHPIVDIAALGDKVYVTDPGNPFDLSIPKGIKIIDSTTDTYIGNVSADQFFGSIEVASISSNDTVGYSAFVPSGQQNTFIQSSNGSFGTIRRGESGIILHSVVLNNTGDANAVVDASFSTGTGTLFGLVNGSNILGASNFSLGNINASIPNPWIALLDSGSNVQVGVAPYGMETPLDAKLYVPINQPGGSYSGTVVLTFANQ